MPGAAAAPPKIKTPLPSGDSAIAAFDIPCIPYCKDGPVMQNKRIIRLCELFVVVAMQFDLS